MPKPSPTITTQARLPASLQGVSREFLEARVRRLVAELRPIAESVPGLGQYLHYVSLPKTAMGTGIGFTVDVNQATLDRYRNQISLKLKSIRSGQCQQFSRMIMSVENDVAANTSARHALTLQIEEARVRLETASRTMDANARTAVKTLFKGNVIGAASAAGSGPSDFERFRQAQNELASLETRYAELGQEREMLDRLLDALRMEYIKCMQEHAIIWGG